MESGFADGSSRKGHDSDAEDASSGYSSCEGSEFERYCSANSVFGSASQCSSVGTCNEFLDSVKNHAESCSLREKFSWSRWSGDASTSGGYDCLSDGGVESPRENDCSENNATTSVMDQLPRMRTGSKLFLSSNENSSSCKGDCSTREAIYVHHNDGNSCDGSLPCTSVCEERMDFDKNLGGAFTGFVSDSLTRHRMMLEADDNASSRGECSDGEDSMLDYGTDDDRIHLYEGNSSQCVKETKPKNENPLLINSSVAFGSSDWDEFMQETGENGFTSLSLYQNQPVQQQQGPSEMKGKLLVTIMDHVNILSLHEMEQEDVRDIPVTSYQSVGKPLEDHEVMDEHKHLADQEGGMYSKYDGRGSDIQYVCSEEVYNTDTDRASEKKVICESELSRAPLCNSIPLQSYSTLTRVSRGKEVGTQQFDSARQFLPVDKNGHGSSVLRVVEGNSNSTDVVEEDLIPDEVKKLDTNGSYDEMVLEMEEILLDSGKSHGRFTQANQGYITQQSHHFRDGSSTASTSGTDDACPHVHCPAKIDRVEVVGAKQKQGDVSFGERLVGVKEYTVYKLKVWSGTDQWEVERRYRDFYALYRQLKTLFTDHGLSLPSPWSNIERDSRKIFGNASPTVISERSTLIQNCLRSILNARYPFGIPNSLVCFLSPSKAIHGSGLLKAFIPQYLQKLGQDGKSKFSNSEEKCSEDIPVFGKTISLVVEIKSRRSLRQLLEAQQYSCAGCHRHLDAGKTLLREIVQTFGWNKPRFCEYSGQLFCASCHTNDTSVLPARVLHQWDFSLYPVSQIAKAYLESVYDQPMLCVSAVNPFLFSKVPALLHVVGIRKKIGAMLPYVRCPFRRSVQKGLGLRRHLLESNDFFALRDLVDLSKGAFAALPIMLETISNKIFEHITQQCLECYDAGVPCAARQACDDPSSLIFPFQESEAARCNSCGSIFHKTCFRNQLMGCPCSRLTSATTEQVPPHGAGQELSIQPPDSNPTSGFFSDILSKARPDKIWKPKNRSPVILMGSLPSTGL